METQTINSIDTASLLRDGEILVGKITKPFIQDGKLMGAILRFEGKSETALLHRKQMVGNDKSARLTNMKLGDELLVKLMVSGEQPERKTWASEAGIENSVIIDRLVAQRPTRVASKVINTTDYGVFLELQEGAGAGRRGLVHAKNMGNGKAASLGSFVSFDPVATVHVDVLGAELDTKGTLRIDLTLSKAA